ncbi:class III lanthionine synthetase LanKC [Clostridium sp. E02]|uniref:class III lanthionine synthetase LanKC n=1 Tax=Clostridium sp. E02 TaxID=2487134 RepID=UPI000F51F983|nr:class III lanthionine synthetase LanKC [Clostridium sp. E02]
MDPRYMMYVFGNSKYYKPSKKNMFKTMFKVPQLPDGWEERLDEEKHWRYCLRKGSRLPRQGWKIHISCNSPDAQKALNIVASILYKKEVDFKFVCSKIELNIKNSKYGNRGASGKFITVYPVSEEQFLELLEALNEATKNIPKGPYILSDRRWKENNVYFRYGGFAEMYLIENGQKKLAIMNDKDELIVDERGPSYLLPNFVKEPNAIKIMETEQNKNEQQSSLLDNYNITEALHFSNGGGVYSATDKRTNIEVVIKEGRPGAAVDSNGTYAFERVKNEIEALRKLVGLESVVQYIDHFQVWEHIFLVEEKIEGYTLNTWIAKNYPFIEGNGDINNYGNKAMIILENLLNAIKSIHNAGIAMGDISLTNVMINPKNLNIKFIDLESAGDPYIGKTGLGTMGFMTSLAKTKEQADWFGIMRIFRQVYLPICDIHEIDPAVDYKLDKWIENSYNNGKKIIKSIREVEDICAKKIKGFSEKYKPTNSYYEKNIRLTLPKTIEKMRATMVEELKLSQIILQGDIRQYVSKGGKLNVMTGGFGIVLALSRTGELPEVARQWVERYSAHKYLKNLDDGLFTGKAGVACVLYELGYKQLSRKVINNINIEKEEIADVSILSGLAGTGLALLSLTSDSEFTDLLPCCITIAKQLEKAFQKDAKIIKIDDDFITMGLIDGWAGVSMFFTALYRATNNKKWLNNAIITLKKDIDNCIRDEHGVLHTDDKSRILPYLAGGSVGIAIAIHQLQEFIPQDMFIEELRDILKMNKTRVCYNGGLFRGFGSFILVNNILHCCDPNAPDITLKLLHHLNNYIVEDDNNLFIAGDYGYKLSHDLYTGSAGILLTLYDIGRNKYLSWFPIPKSPFLRC